MTLSLRTRLTAWYTVGLSVTLLGFGAVLERALTRDLRAEFDEHLESAAGVAQFAVGDMLRDAGAETARTRLLHELRFIDITVAIAIDRPDGSRSWFVGSDSALLAATGPGPCRSSPVTRSRLAQAAYRALVRCFSVGRATSLTLVVGAPELELAVQRRRIRAIIAAALALGLGLTTLGGHWLSGKAIRPIRRMAGQVEHIGIEGLNQRLPVRPQDGEIAELSRMVNELFDRLATTVGRERQFLANAAHALRTPVTVLQGEVSELSHVPNLPEATRGGLAELAVLTAHLGRTVEYLLSLARRGTDAEAFACEVLYLDDVVSGTVARLIHVAEQRRVRIVWGEFAEAPVQANRHALEQVTQILVENALQYTPSGGTVTVSVQPRNGCGELSVEDTGPGFAPGELDTLFSPFVRGSAARLSTFPGSGLGLAVARWMVESCGGRLRADPLVTGARFVVELPRADRASPG